MEMDQFKSHETWEGITEQLKTRIQDIYPAWTDFNAHDPGMALMELLAFMKDIQLFHMEQISREHKRKYCKLLGIQRRGAASSGTYVTVSAKEQVLMPEGTKFFAGDICFEAVRKQAAADNIFAGFSMIEDGETGRIRGDWLKSGAGLCLYPFGRHPKAGCVCEIELLYPLKADWPYSLSVDVAESADISFVKEGAYDGYGFYALGEILMEYRTKEGWKKVSVQMDTTYGFTQQGALDFFIMDEMDKKSPKLKLTLLRADYLIPPCLLRISLARIPAVQQETGDGEIIWTGNGFRGQRYELQGFHILKHSLEIEVEGEAWELVEDFDSSLPGSRHYCFEDGFLCFGDGICGRVPRGMISVKKWAKTLGSKGNIKAYSIDRTDFAKEGNVITVFNEKESSGGWDEETEEELLERFDWGEHNLHRAATLADYEFLVRHIPGLSIADCKAYEENPGRNQIVLAVRPRTPDGYGELNQAYIRNIYTFLEEKRLLGTRLLVVSPEYIPIRISCEITAKVKYRDAKELVEREITAWMGTKTFGQGIVYGELYGVIDTLPCVSVIHSLWLEAGSRGKRNARGDLSLQKRGLMKLIKVTCLLLTER